MTPTGRALDECPSWSNLVRFLAEGGPWPAEHLRTCPRCNERRAFLESLSVSAAVAPRPGGGDVACPDPIRLIGWVEGKADAGERVRLAEHVASCEACAGLFRELVVLHDADETTWEVRDEPLELAGIPADRAPPARSARRLWAGRVAAVLLAAAVVTAVFVVPFPAIDSGIADRWRGPVPRIEGSIEWPAEQSSPTLQWDRRPEAGSYRIRMWDSGGAQRFERHVAATEPLQALLAPERPVAGEVFLWQLDALDGGEVVASSGPTELTWRDR